MDSRDEQQSKETPALGSGWEDVLFKHLGDSVCIHDRFGRFVEVNKEMCRVLGYSRCELLEMNVSDLDSTVSLDVLDGLWARMPPEQPITVEGIHTSKDGREIPVEVRIVKFFRDEEALFIVVARDITNRVFASEHTEQLNAQLRHAHRQALAANHARDRLLANMSHELRTPLNAIIGYSELLQEDIDDVQHCDDLGKILGSAKHLLGLIDDVLDLSHHESLRVRAEPIDCDLSILIEDVYRGFLPLLEHEDRGNTLTRSIAPGIEAFTDPDKVEQIALNLLSNANKFTRDGQILLSLERDGEDAILIVKDTGEGIRDTQQLFIPFGVLESSDSSIRQGKGLGLAICKRYVESLGGMISVESAVALGSTFTVTIPLQIEERHTEQLEHKRAYMNQPGGIVCLSLESCSEVAKSARDKGIQGVAYKDTERFVAAADALRPDLVVLEMSEAYPDARAAGHKLKTMATTSYCRILLHLYDSDNKRGLLLEDFDDVLFSPMCKQALAANLRRHGLKDEGDLWAISPPACLRADLPAGARVVERDDVLRCDGSLGAEQRSPTHVLLDFVACGPQTLCVLRRLQQRHPSAVFLLLVAKEASAVEYRDTIHALLDAHGAPIDLVHDRMSTIAAQLD